MIGKIKGQVSEIDGETALIETSSGIFYNVFFTRGLLLDYHINDTVEVYTYHHIREDQQLLFAFAEKSEFMLFQLLMSVSGVGAKSAYSIISYSSVNELVDAVKKNEVSYFTRIPGLGKKTSMKIILELSTKFKSDFKFQSSSPVSEDDQTVVEALSSLGFSSDEVREILPKLKGKTVEMRVSEAIRMLSNSL